MVIEKFTGNDSVKSLEGLFSESPLITLGFFIPLFSLVGMPGTFGFPVMQSFFTEFSVNVPQFIIFLIISQILLSVTMIRWVFNSMKNERDISIPKERALPETILLLTFTFGLIILGVFPNIAYPKIGDIVNYLQFLIK
jgi:formate hydrogenlyase subunit 3/multisubunit Na+/H+ antiporter MnhD subunit